MNTISSSQNTISAARSQNNPVTSTLDTLVSSGTITQTQEDAILKALEDSMKTNKSDSNKSNKTITNPLDSLVSSGTITQDQETTIEGAFESAFENAM